MEFWERNEGCESNRKLCGLGLEFYGFVWQSELCELIVDFSVSRLSLPDASLFVYQIWGTCDPFLSCSY